MTALSDPAALAAHLSPDRMARAHRELVAKALGELAHELVLTPVPEPDGYAVSVDDVTYRFRARRLPLEHWLVDPASIVRLAQGAPTRVDAQRMVLDLRPLLGIPDADLPLYLEEVASTLAGRAWKLRPDAPDAGTLLTASFQEIEAAMTEGHPCFVANNGRIGLGAADYRAYAPETGPRVRLVWLAVHRDRSVFASIDGLDYADLLAAEFDAATLARFDQRLRDLDLDPAAYRLMPCHPWQWEHKIAITLAPEVARRDIVCVGLGDDTHQPQQSVRTFFNLDRPERHYVKTALSVLNMGFLRGLSPGYMRDTPAINTWVAGVVAGDATLQEHRFSVLREVAAVGYHAEVYEEAGRSGYGKMLSGLWRESPLPGLARSERLATMASLLHVDAKGTAYVAELVAASGLPAEEWLRRYLAAYWVPLLHCFYAHRLVFMPHGENLLLVLEDHVVTRVIMKDIGEEVAVFDTAADLPPGADRIVVDVDHDLEVLALFTDVLDCFFRFLGGLLDDQGVLPADDFWAVVRQVSRDYQAAHPELADRFAAHDLFAPEFARSCLNRLQLRNHQEMLDLADPTDALALVGTLANPLAPPAVTG